MLIDLSELLSHEGLTKKITVDIEMDKFVSKFDSYEICDKNPVDLLLTNIGKKRILIETLVDISLLMPCDRCIENVITNIKLNISKEIDMNESKSDRYNAIDEFDFINATYLDVDKFIYGEILIELPMKVLCDNKCKGICNRCGTNLNIQSCDCDATELDPRMSKVLDVFNEYKEV